MKRTRKVVLIGGVVVIAAAAIALGAVALRRARAGTAAQAPSPTATVSRGSIQQTVTATGTVAAERQGPVSFDSSGRIAEVLAKEGQSVRAGQVLARLDTSSLEWQVARAEASLQTALARLNQAQKPASSAQLASAQAALDSARASHEKTKAGPTPEELASSQASLESAKANYEKVKAGPTAADLAAAKAALDSAQASLKQAQAAYDLVKGRPEIAMLPQSLNLQSATIEYRRAKANYDAAANHPTAAELATARSQLLQAEAQLSQLQARPTASELAAAAAQVSQAEAQLEQLRAQPDADSVAVAQAQAAEAQVALDQTRAQLDAAVLKAPFDGTVVAVNVGEGEWASPGSPAFVVASTGSLLVESNVDEVDVAQLAVGQPASLRLTALKGNNLTGAVAAIAPAAVNVGGAQAYKVQIGFLPAELPVRLGMTAEVEIVVASADDTLLVPNEAITADREAGRYYVNRLGAGGLAQRVEVRIGLRDSQQTQIVEGLREGDRLELPNLQPTSQSSNTGPFGGMGQQFRNADGGN